MKDYISREAAMEALLDAEAINHATDDEQKVYHYAIEGVPAADVRPVVTCKQCSLWCKDESKLKTTAPCSHWSNLEDAAYIYTNENDFCSYGISEVEE